MKKSIIIVLLGIATASAIWFYSPVKRSLGAGGPIVFGGRLAFVQFCCNGFALGIGGARPGTFLLGPGSLVYQYYNVFTPGAEVLGTAAPGGICLNPLFFCTPLPVQGTIINIGTSGL